MNPAGIIKYVIGFFSAKRNLLSNFTITCEIQFKMILKDLPKVQNDRLVANSFAYCLS